MDVTDCVGLSADGAVFQLGQRYLRISLVHYTGTLLHCTALRCITQGPPIVGKISASMTFLFLFLVKRNHQRLHQGYRKRLLSDSKQLDLVSALVS